MTPAADPTPLAKCQVAASHDSPLVTEWPASAKAHLETLLAQRAVAVSYSGCELRIADECSLPGRYVWQRTTLSTDTVEIQNADELWAKLPLGAAALEAELERSGRLAVRTTVSGQMRLEAPPGPVPEDGSCAAVTHVVSAISVGAFRMMSGGAVRGGGSASTPIGGASAESRRQESLLREAGDAERCHESTDAAASMDCASPIQLFLLPVQKASTAATRVAELADARARERGILVSIPASDDSEERWSLHDADGNRLCDLPCERWIAQRSGYYLEREQTEGHPRVRLDVPNELPHDAGAHVTAKYAPERGQPFWSAVTFYGLGLPLAVGSVATLAVGIGDSSHRSFWLGASVFYGLGAAASFWWYFYSRPSSFVTYGEAPPRTATGLRFGPGFVTGTF